MYHYAEDHEIDLIEREVAELFAEFDIEAYDDVSSASSILSYNEASTSGCYIRNYENESLSDVFINWYNSRSAESLEGFLSQQEVQKFLTPEAFRDVVNGNAFVPTEFLYIIRNRFQSKISARKLDRLNREVKNNNSAYCINMSIPEIMQLRAILQKQEKERKKNKFQDYAIAYRQQNREEINRKRRQRWRENFEERLESRIRLFKKRYQDRMTPELNKRLYYLEHEALRKHNYYLANKEVFRERCRKWRDENPERLKKILKEYRRKHAARIASIKRRYYEKHKAELLEKAKTWRENNPEKVQETSRRNYAQNRDKRREQNKEWIKNNPEARQRQKARYYAAHAAEIAAKEARRRNKKRFQTKTGTKILGLLQGIIQTRS